MAHHISRRQVLRIGLLVAGIGALLTILSERLGNWLNPMQRSPESGSPPAAPLIVPRADWGARLPDHTAPEELGFASKATEPEWYIYPGDLTDEYNTIAIHHSASLLASNETMLDIQNLHMDANRWADIGYHYGIDRDGIVYEGRDIGSRGASVAGFNTGTIGVVVMGNFEEDQPLPPQLAALQTVVNWLTASYKLTHLAAHGEFNPESVCPGKNLIPYLDSLARSAGLARGTAGHVPPSP